MLNINCIDNILNKIEALSNGINPNGINENITYKDQKYTIKFSENISENTIPDCVVIFSEKCKINEICCIIYNTYGNNCPYISYHSYKSYSVSKCIEYTLLMISENKIYKSNPSILDLPTPPMPIVIKNHINITINEIGFVLHHKSLNNEVNNKIIFYGSIIKNK